MSAGKVVSGVLAGITIETGFRNFIYTSKSFKTRQQIMDRVE